MFQAKGKKPLFVAFILDNLWEAYDAVLIRRSVRMWKNKINIGLIYFMNFYLYLDFSHKCPSEAGTQNLRVILCFPLLY